MISLLVCVLLAALPAQAIDLTPESLLGFADHLFGQGDYYRAITEYERLQFLFPASPLARTARFQVALCYLQGEKYPQAIERFRAFVKDLGGDPLAERAQFLLAEACMRKGDYPLAINALESYLQLFPESPRKDAARLKLGICYLRRGAWERARDEFRGLPPDSPLAVQASGLAEDAEQYPSLPHKSPVLAGTLSIVPGGGQLYVGRPGDATAALLLNGVFLWGAAQSYHRGNRVAAGILAFFEAGWYAGNIYSAVNAAHKYNRQAEQRYFKRIESQYDITLSRTEAGDLVAALQMKF